MTTQLPLAGKCPFEDCQQEYRIHFERGTDGKMYAVIRGCPHVHLMAKEATRRLRAKVAKEILEITRKPD